MYSHMIRLSIRTGYISQNFIRSISITRKLQEKYLLNDEISTQDHRNKLKISSENQKIYSEQIHRIVNEISRLSFIEMMDLNDLLKKKENEETYSKAESIFKIRLIKFDESKKLSVIKEVKNIVENINLIQAKKIVESIPQILRDNLTKIDAETMKIKLEAVGGVCVIE